VVAYVPRVHHFEKFIYFLFINYIMEFNEKDKYIGIGFALGISFGVAFGAAFGNVGMGLVIGMIVGMFAGVLYPRIKLK